MENKDNKDNKPNTNKPEEKKTDNKKRYKKRYKKRKPKNPEAASGEKPKQPQRQPQKQKGGQNKNKQVRKITVEQQKKQKPQKKSVASEKLSHNFSRKDFSCKCGSCNEKFKISLGIVGILEHIGSHFKKKITIVEAYRCPDAVEKLNSMKKSYHGLGKAVDFYIEGIELSQVYNFVLTLDEIHGIGLYPNKKHIHIDLRENERTEWVYERNQYITLTDAKKAQYNLTSE